MKDAPHHAFNPVATDVDFGWQHGCAILGGEHLSCWGANFYGQAGYPGAEHIGDDESLTQVGTVDVGGAVSSVSAGRNHTCALLANGTVRCWGCNEGGQLGLGTVEPFDTNLSPSALPVVQIFGPGE